jgi:hypothetical protein
MPAHVLLQLVLGRWAGEGVGCPVTQHEPGNRERVLKRVCGNGSRHVRKGEVELRMQADGPCEACVEVVGGCAEVLEHAIASGVRVFERHDEHALLAELIRGMYRVGTPFAIGDVIEHMTDHTDLDPLGWGRRYQRAIKDAGVWTAPGEHRPQTGMRLYCIHMSEVLKHETCEVPGTGAPIDSTRAFGIAGEDPPQDPVHMGSLLGASQEGCEGICIFRCVPWKAYYRLHRVLLRKLPVGADKIVVVK